MAVKGDGDAAVALHVRTPCIGSVSLSQKTKCRVLLKLENTQPSGSFKIRGIGERALTGMELKHEVKMRTESGIGV